MDGMFWLNVAGFFTLIGLSAFFAGAETVLTAVSRARMHALESDGNPRAKLVIRLRETKEKMIGGLLLGNTLSHVAASVLATSILIKLFGETGMVYATVIVSSMVLIFGEVMPKTYAMMHADRLALLIAPLVSFLLKLFWPVIYTVEKLVHGTFHVFGMKHPKGMAGAHEEELRGAIELFKETMDVEEDQETGAMLRSILDLGDVTVEDIMVHRKSVHMINGDLPVEKIIDEVLHSTFTRLPVWKESPDNIIGVIHTKLLLREIRLCNGDATKAVLAHTMMEPWFIPESTSLIDQLHAFRKRREHFAIMVDEYGALMGVVTLEDILEEIVGEISDEHDAVVNGVRAQKDGSYTVDGNVTIRDLNREFEWGLPDEDYSTIAGLVLFESQRIPDIGQSYTFFGFRFDILRKQRNQVTLLRITPSLPDEDKKEH